MLLVPPPMSTLAMAVQREAAISAFTPEKFYTVLLAFVGGGTASSKRFSQKADAERLLTRCRKEVQTTVQKVERKEKAEKPPQLYDLTTLQRDANRLLGFTAQQTLNYAQSLYEKKLITYPRTDSRFLTEDMAASLPGLAAAIADTFGVETSTTNARQVVDNSKVTDHHALLPTASVARTDFSALPSGEQSVLRLIVARLLCAVGEPHRYAETSMTTICAGEEFSAKGKVVLDEGWKGIERKMLGDLLGKKKESAALPDVQEQNECSIVGAELKEGQTTPPKHYTEDTLLRSMETASADSMPEDAERQGLGTPATRAAMIEKLLSAGFVERKGKSLVPTKDGINLAVILPDMLKSPLLTAEWETRLTEIAKGSDDPQSFMQGIEDMTRELVKRYSHITEDGKKLFAPEKEAVGICPRCKSPVYEGKKNFYCSDRSCRFVMWKNDKFFESRRTVFSKKIAAALLKDGKAKVKGLYSERTDKTYDGTVLLCDTGEKYVNYRIEQRK